MIPAIMNNSNNEPPLAPVAPMPVLFAPPAGAGASLSVTAVIATYRRPGWVIEAVDSVLNQGPMVAEVIVVDDCPKGSAAESIARFTDPRVRYYANPEPSGGRPAVPRNLGWKVATGSILHFLDDDDRVAEDFYGDALAAFAAEPEIGVVFGRVEPFGDDAEQVGQQSAFFEDAARRARVRSRWGARHGFAIEMTFNPVLYVGGAALIRQHCVAALNGFDPSILVIEDTDFFARAMARYGAYFLDKTALRYRIAPSITRRPAIEGIVRENYRRLHGNSQREWGRMGFLARKVVARTLFRQRRH